VTVRLRWLPALLLLAGVLFQAPRILVKDLSAQGSGPGFAMFARIDTVDTRFLRLYGEVGGTVRPLREIDPRLADVAYRYRTLPSEENGETLARALLGERWRAEKDRLVAVAEADSGAALEAVRVELWGVEYRHGAVAPVLKRVVELEREH
jgi:hypothetical protein